MAKTGSRSRRLHIGLPLSIWLSLTVAVAPAGAAEMLSATTIPNPDAYTTTWYFAGEKAIRLSSESKDGEVLGHLDAYGLGDGKLLWHADRSLGRGAKGGGAMLVNDPGHDRWYLGTGPLSRLDLATGAIRWSLPCDQLGYVEPTTARFLSGDRLLLMGTKGCSPGSAYDALKEPRLTMVDANTGKILWQYEPKSLEYDASLGYWAKVKQYKGQRAIVRKRIQLDAMLASPKAGGFEFDAPDPDRIVIMGERYEGVKLADGASLFKSTDKPGILRGAYDGRVFFQDFEKVTAFDAGSGAAIWTFDSGDRGSRVYTVDDFDAMGASVPEDMHDIFVSTGDRAVRVSAATGKETWAVKRGGAVWSASKHALMAESGDKITAYDWISGAKIWEAPISWTPRPRDAGDFIVFVAALTDEDNELVPPFKVTVVHGKTGRIAWAKSDLDGKPISEWLLIGTERIALMNEAGTVATLNVADGTATQAPARLEERYLVKYLENSRVLQCHDYLGNLVWERPGESGLSKPNFLTGKTCVVWVSKEGDVEVIDRADGSTLWKVQGLEEPQVYVDESGAYLVVQSKKDATVVKLPS
ncbi:MAG TPA: PQQ-binding-like beta-propeller repeat protein [Candidatus Eisenbacteria bacterium]|nr:PQQ-binding-like beta-propeller repeat protein [Candidatus Eisenbacteria bacterium]